MQLSRLRKALQQGVAAPASRSDAQMLEDASKMLQHALHAKRCKEKLTKEAEGYLQQRGLSLGNQLEAVVEQPGIQSGSEDKTDSDPEELVVEQFGQLAMQTGPTDEAGSTNDQGTVIAKDQLAAHTGPADTMDPVYMYEESNTLKVAMDKCRPGLKMTPDLTTCMKIAIN